MSLPLNPPITETVVALPEGLPAVGPEVLPQGARTPGWHEHVGVWAFFLLGAALAWRVLGALSMANAPWVLLALVAGYVAADFFSGFVHWAFDTWGSEDTPVLGPTFIVPFRIHHSDPEDITRHGFIATNGHNCLAVAPLLGAALFADPQVWAAPLTFLGSLALGIFGTNQFHKWSHEQQVGPVVAWLQRWHLVLPPGHHDVHHTRPYDAHYCITTGWLNVLLMRIGFFRRAERLISRVTGWQPRADDLKQA